ncbi:MAG TPA: GntR family transcriptional regulator [Candidatus Limnocylindria bacterium]|nr:GntR family transcriptional regulator [Candidatus Limnocylindria bacterium]
MGSADANLFSRPPTAQEAVLVELRKEIASGALRPGEQVLQETIADRLGVSRVPLREALKFLEGEGQVVYHPHRGYFVAELSVADLVEVYRIRDLLEAEAVQVGVGRATDEQKEAIRLHRLACEAAAERGDLVDMSAANRAFHFAVYETSGMPRLVRMIRLCWDATDVYRSVYYASQSHREAAVREHRAIARAFAAEDAATTVRLLAKHREHAVAAVTDAITS